MSVTASDYNEPARAPAALDEAEADDVPAPDLLRLPAIAGAGQRADRFLASALAPLIEGVSRSRVQRWFDLGAVWSDDRVLLASTRLAGFETLCVQPLPREADEAFAPDPIDLVVVHEDDDVLVIAKPAGLVVHPAAGNWRGTLLNGLLHRRPALGKLPRAGIVHRLDKDTSGLLAVAASERALSALARQLAERTMARRYLALAWGAIDAAFEIDAPIGRDPRQRTRMAVVEPPGGRLARTRVRPLAQGSWQGRAVSLVECALHTGRTHQIRVHMRHIGRPLLGDPVYGPAGGPMARQALHAWRLGFLHPDGRGPCDWRDPPPADFSAAMQAVGVASEVLAHEVD